MLLSVRAFCPAPSCITSWRPETVSLRVSRRLKASSTLPPPLNIPSRVPYAAYPERRMRRLTAVVVRNPGCMRNPSSLLKLASL